MWLQSEALRVVLVPRPVFETEASEALQDEQALRWWLSTQSENRRADVHTVGDQSRRFGKLIVPEKRLWHHIEGFQDSMWHRVLEQLSGERLYESALILSSWETTGRRTRQ